MQLTGFQCRECITYFRFREEPTHDGTFQSLLEGVADKRVECPSCGCESFRPVFDEEISAGSAQPAVAELTYMQLWTALNGGGLPDEVVIGTKTVHDALTGQTVRSVSLSAAPNGRCIVESILMESGTMLHFAPSGYGAAIYRVTKERNDAGTGEGLRDRADGRDQADDAARSEGGPPPGDAVRGQEEQDPGPSGD